MIVGRGVGTRASVGIGRKRDLTDIGGGLYGSSEVLARTADQGRQLLVKMLGVVWDRHGEAVARAAAPELAAMLWGEARLSDRERRRV